MNSARATVVLFALVAVLSGGSCSSKSVPERVHLPTVGSESSLLGSTTKAHAPDGQVITVIATTEPYDESSHGRIRMDGTTPEMLLKDLEIFVDGRDVSPPRTEYSGIGDPIVGSRSSPLRVDWDSSGLYFVYLSGGDGGGSHGRRFVVSPSAWIRTEGRNYVTGDYGLRKN